MYIHMFVHLRISLRGDKKFMNNNCLWGENNGAEGQASEKTVFASFF